MSNIPIILRDLRFSTKEDKIIYMLQTKNSHPVKLLSATQMSNPLCKIDFYWSFRIRFPYHIGNR